MTNFDEFLENVNLVSNSVQKIVEGKIDEKEFKQIEA